METAQLVANFAATVGAEACRQSTHTHTVAHTGTCVLCVTPRGGFDWGMPHLKNATTLAWEFRLVGKLELQ